MHRLCALLVANGRRICFSIGSSWILESRGGRRDVHSSEGPSQTVRGGRSVSCTEIVSV